MSYNNNLINLKKKLLKIWHNQIIKNTLKLSIKRTQNKKIATAFKQRILDEDLEYQVYTLFFIPTIVLEEVLDSIDSYINKKEVLALIKKKKAQEYQYRRDYFHKGKLYDLQAGEGAFYELQFSKAIQNLENYFSKDELAEYNKTKSLPTSLEKMLENSYFAKVHNHAHSIAMQEIDKHIPAVAEMFITQMLKIEILEASGWCPTEEFYNIILTMRELDVSYREFEQPFEIYECKIRERAFLTLKTKEDRKDPKDPFSQD